MAPKSNASSSSTAVVQGGFNITITGRSMDLSDALKNYAIEKISKFERFSNRIVDVMVTLDVQKVMKRADIVMKVDHTVIKSRAETTDMYVSIDEAVDKLGIQLRKYRSRVTDHHIKPKAKAAIDMNVNIFQSPAEEQLLDINNAIEDRNQDTLIERYRPHTIKSQKKLPLHLLSRDEAIIKMELSGDNFMLYRAEEDNKLKVIYLRDDGNFGIIEPEV